MQGNKEERINIEIKSDDEKKTHWKIFRDCRFGNKSLSTQFQGEKKKKENEGKLI